MSDSDPFDPSSTDSPPLRTASPSKKSSTAARSIPQEPAHESGHQMRALLQRALAEPPEPSRSLLPKIQQKIRLRTRGRYYRDRWSTSRHPISFILMMTLLLLVLSAALFLVLQPLVDPATPTLLSPPVVDPLAVDQ